MNPKILSRFTLENHHHQYPLDSMTDVYPQGRPSALLTGALRYHGRPCRVCSGTLKRTKQRDCIACHNTRNTQANSTEPYRMARKVHKRLHRQGLQDAFAPWANRAVMRDVYRKARLSGHEVDHVIPLRHPMVCGLHVEHNLQLLPPAENRAKSNHYQTDWDSP